MDTATMTAGPTDQRRLLGAFIRAHRENLPAPGGAMARRRTAGLRREEVASLCGISTTWYTWIEQGRDVSISPQALARLADALHLTPAERAYVFELSRKRDPAPPPLRVATPKLPSSSLQAAVQAVAAPAYVLDRLWNACAWNGRAAHLFGDWLGGEERCLLRYVFLDPTAPRLICDWEDRARRLLAEFRADTALAQDDPRMQALIDSLRRDSASFDRFWQEHAVLGREGGARLFDHPTDGRLCFQQVTLIPAGRADHKFVILLPDPNGNG